MTGTLAPRKAIVIGFVGGFVKPDDLKHPEVQFSACLRERHPTIVRTKVFTNREEKRALRQILNWLDADGNGTPTALEKREAAIIIYGHSWGALQTVELARALAQQGIPVLLTIQVDSVHKTRPRRFHNSAQRKERDQLLSDQRPHSWAPCHSRG